MVLSEGCSEHERTNEFWLLAEWSISPAPRRIAALGCGDATGTSLRSARAISVLTYSFRVRLTRWSDWTVSVEF